MATPGRAGYSRGQTASRDRYRFWLRFWLVLLLMLASGLPDPPGPLLAPAPLIPLLVPRLVSVCERVEEFNPLEVPPVVVLLLVPVVETG